MQTQQSSNREFNKGADLKDQVNSAFGNVAEKAKDYVSDGKEQMEKAANELLTEGKRVMNESQTWIRNHPFMALAVAGILGILMVNGLTQRNAHN